MWNIICNNKSILWNLFSNSLYLSISIFNYVNNNVTVLWQTIIKTGITAIADSQYPEYNNNINKISTLVMTN